MGDNTPSFDQALNYLCCLSFGEFHSQCVDLVWKEVTRLRAIEVATQTAKLQEGGKDL